MSNPKHRARAVEAMAHHICTSDFTDGFCSPRDGVCHNPSADKRSLRLNCMAAAEGCMKAMETRGIVVSWPHDKTLKQ